jgi:tetratricopeptide (TPR) repeat protein
LRTKFFVEVADIGAMNPGNCRGSILASSARGALGLAVAFAALSCAHDAAEEEYFTALRGEENGMTRVEQLEHIDRAIAMNPRRVSYRETHAIYSIDMRHYETAAADLDTAILLGDRPYLRFLRGLVACERRKYESSLADFDRAIEGQPENTQFYRGRSLARTALGRYPEALEDAERLVRLVPQQAESHYALGMALAGLGRFREAAHAFDEAQSRGPELIYPLRARAATYERLGDPLRAAEDRDEADRREAENPYNAVCLDPFRY